jgi:hypothetical protein
MSCIPGTSIATMADRTPEDETVGGASMNDQLLLAIFWDGSLADKIQEAGGTTIGFSQVRCRMLESLVAAPHRTNA